MVLSVSFGTNYVKNLGVFIGFLMLAAVNMKEPSSK